MDGQHTRLRGPWHYCGSCGEKTKLAEMRWQRGVLKCLQCYDKRLIGEREVIIASVLNDGKKELTLDPKLRHVDTETDAGDISIAGI